MTDIAADPEIVDTFYDPAATHRDALYAIERGAIESLATPEQAKAQAAEWLPVFGNYLRGNSTASLELADLIVSTKRTPASTEQRRAWTAQSEEALRQEYGDGAGAAIADARALMAKDKSLGKFLDSSGLGSHPKFVRVFVGRAVELRKQGRL